MFKNNNVVFTQGLTWNSPIHLSVQLLFRLDHHASILCKKRITDIYTYQNEMEVEKSIIIPILGLTQIFHNENCARQHSSQFHYASGMVVKKLDEHMGCSLALAGEKNDYEHTNSHIYIYLSRASNVLDVSTCRVQSPNQAATPLHPPPPPPPPQCTTWSGRDSLASVRGGLSV